MLTSIIRLMNNPKRLQKKYGVEIEIEPHQTYLVPHNPKLKSHRTCQKLTKKHRE